MRDQGVMGLPVVNQDGVVVESISVSDLKQIGFDGSLFSKLDISIKVRTQGSPILMITNVLCRTCSNTTKETVLIWLRPSIQLPKWLNC